MIFINGYPKVTGASDLEDSSHLAGILAIFDHTEAISCKEYIFWELGDFIYKRHPESKYDFSRDQFICLASGLIKQGSGDFVDLKFVNGRDIMPPSVRGLVRIAHGKKPRFYQSMWLKAEIYWHSYLQPLEEPFQLIALCMTYDNFNGNNNFLKLWTKLNNKWHWSIRRYLSELDGAWRGEKELAEFIIEKVKEKI
jgi:hypothetical protein